MKVLVLYVVLVLLGGVVAYEVGLFVEATWGSAMSLIVFLSMFFLNFVIMWMIAVRVVEHLAKKSAAPAP